METSAQWLQTGIAAVKAGDLEEGRRLLLQVLQDDERNETAWLWLSGAVTTVEERRICLENVLELNPRSELARKGLRRLGIDPDETVHEAAQDVLPADPSAPAPPVTQTVRREYQPLSTAAALLYPERQVKEWTWRDPTAPLTANRVTFTTESQYDDVWARGSDICPYCACEVADADERCPQCKRPLLTRQFRYPQPSTHMHVLWVLLFGLAQISLLQLIYNVIFTGNLIGAVLNGVLIIIFFVLAAGVYWRQFWAYAGAIVLLSIMLVVVVMRFLLPPQLVVDLAAGFDPAIAAFLGSMATGFGRFLLIFQTGAVVLALFYAVIMAAPDFDRTEKRQLAFITRGLSTGGDYHNVAQRAAQAGMWATAVLHWQRAAANDPGVYAYQRRLAQAYNKLGHYQRSLDVLQVARQRVTTPEKQAEFDQLIAETKQLMAAAQQAAAV